MYSSDEKTFSLIDFLVELLFRWKFLLLVTVLITVLIAGFDAFRSFRQSRGNSDAAREISQEEVQAARDALLESTRNAITDTEAEEVERIYDQYQSYLEHRKVLQKELSYYDEVFGQLGEDMMIRRSTYGLSSTQIGTENQFSTNTLDVKDYRRIMEIMPEVKTLSAAYKCVAIGSIVENTTELTNYGEKEQVRPFNYMLAVEVLGSDQEACDQVMAVVDEAFRRKIQEMKKVDPDISLTDLGTTYRANINEYNIGRKQPVFDNIQKVDATINTLKSNVIDRLPEEQAAYYKALRDADRSLVENGIFENVKFIEGGQAADSRLIHPKMLIIGVIIGLFLACVASLIRYLFSGMIKTTKEIQDYYKVPVLSTVFVKGNRGRGLFPGLIRKLLHVDSMTVENRAGMIAADICGGMQQAQSDSVYIVRTCGDGADLNIASLLEKAVAGRRPESQIYAGSPLTSVDEMQNLTQQKTALLLVHNKRTVQADLEKVLDLCNRQSVKVLGAVAITDI